MPTTEPLPPTEPNYDAMARAWQEEGLGENPPPLPRMEPPPPPPPEPLQGGLKVAFFVGYAFPHVDERRMRRFQDPWNVVKDVD